jgi:hypothetical protein
MARVNKAAAKPKKKTVRSVRRGANLMPLMPTKGLTWEKAKYYTHYEVESKEWLTTVKALLVQLTSYQIGKLVGRVIGLVRLTF